MRLRSQDAGGEATHSAGGHKRSDRTWIDTKNDRISVGGHNKTAQVLDGKTGKLLASFQSGAGTDAAGWDAKNPLAFIFNGEGNITVIQEKSLDRMAQLIGRLSPRSRQFTQFTKH